LENILRIRRLNTGLNQLYLSGAVPRNLEIPVSIIASSVEVSFQRMKQIIDRPEALCGPISLDFSKFYFQNKLKMSPLKTMYIQKYFALVKFTNNQLSSLGDLIKKMKGLE
jgi:hypothetical protein